MMEVSKNDKKIISNNLWRKSAKGILYHKQYNKENVERIRMQQIACHKSEKYKLKKRVYAKTEKHIKYRIVLDKSEKRIALKKIYAKRYRQKHKDKIRIYHREHYHVRMSKDLGFKITNSLRARLAAALQYRIKSIKTKQLIGCDIESLRKYLESKFIEGMSWGNYGLRGWHIDHIRPCASFDLSKPEQQRICFHYTNLQPLWAKDNRMKSDKF